jgi:hypothetical protein
VSLAVRYAKLFGRDERVKDSKDLLSRMNEYLSDGLSLKKHLGGEIIEITFAANETKTVSHRLGKIPAYRLILRQSGNGLITDLDSAWTDKTVGFINNSANAVSITVKIMVE